MTPRPGGAARLVGREWLTPATRQALEARLNEEAPEYRTFTAAEGALLEAVGVCLVPHDPRAMPLAQSIDARLTRGDTDGWRYDDARPDAEAYRELLSALPAGFASADAPAQHAALQQVQQSLSHVFEDLLAELTELFYSQPQAQLNIGYVGFADARGWTQIGLNQLDAHEQDALKLAGEDS